MSIASSAIAEVPVMQSSGAATETRVPSKRRTVATADAPLVPEAR